MKKENSATNNAPEVWHGYDSNACQWLLEPKFQDIHNEAVQKELLEAFSSGKTQVRGVFRDHNLEEGVPNCLYATKLVRRPNQDVEHIFMIRVDQATMQPMDIREIPWGLASAGGTENGLLPVMSQRNFLDMVGDNQAVMSGTFHEVFQAIAEWHAESFGVGPMAPQGTAPDCPDTADEWIKWQQARLQQKTPAKGIATQQGPRL